MSAKLWSAPTQPFQTTLNGSMGTGDTSLSLTNSTGLQAPGVLVINRQDGAGNNTFNKMEFVTFTGISGKNVSGLTRGVAGSVAKSHNSGALVEEYISVTHWGDLLLFLGISHNELTGVDKVLTHVSSLTVTGVSGLSAIKGDVVFVPGSFVTIYSVSGASSYPFVTWNMPVGGGGMQPLQVMGGLVSGANQTPYLIIEEATSLKSISAVVRSPVSGASLVFDINNNLTTVFTDQNTRLSILGGGTFASTASIAVKTLTPGNLMSLDIDNTSTGVGTADNLTVILET